jgi:hypothetical protein
LDSFRRIAGNQSSDFHHRTAPISDSSGSNSGIRGKTICTAAGKTGEAETQETRVGFRGVFLGRERFVTTAIVKFPELGQDSVSEILVESIRPSPDNDKLYRPVDTSDPEIIRLAESIRQNGILEPLIITLDDYILSGHRRYAAAMLAGLEMVPVRVEMIYRDDDIDRFIELLREYNRQREKSLDEKLREELISVDPTEAYQSLIDHREEASKVSTACLTIRGTKHRCKISKAKQPFLDAITEVVWERKKFWPLSDRSIHYALLNNPPLRHASKPSSRYDNTPQSYKSLVELVTRARLDGSIPFEAIADTTRPVTTWNVFQTPQGFIGKQVDQFLKGYWRDLMQSQPNHIEIIGEKNTIDSILK